ncbi:hypothetical protein [Streptomyces iconiensis]|uniref:Excreted virulence factor EspC, type VII ESX diderm n=1 Tax=Streptomyces iconiensis TaxID=1384038 RepID=A0ABT6ZX55_9ACTN|nr:hypothetical protein [Streptomyces iconiensis]MDJ1133389.1 hypothetical protein [Streptomyces iconiensis]
MEHNRSGIYDVIGAPGPPQDRTGLHLASAGEGEDAPWGGGGVKSDQKSWNSASHSVRSLKGAIGKSRSEMHEPGKALGADDFECGRVFGDLHTSWDDYLSKVNGRCATLADRLSKAGSEHHKNDEERKADFDRLNDKYQDTKGLGPKGTGEGAR